MEWGYVSRIDWFAEKLGEGEKKQFDLFIILNFMDIKG